MSKYVAYMLAPQKRDNTRIFFSADELANQEMLLQSFLKDKASTLVATYVETRSHHKQRQVWPELKAAIETCIQQQACLVIPEIRNLTNNDGFTRLIVQAIKKCQSAPFQIMCLDQPFITRDNFEALVLHSKEQRKYHGKLIKEGFDRSKAHPGNPNAAEVLNNINRSKIDNAIIFALLMKPVIHDYQQKGYSQRQMVEHLNQDGFHAPEGGTWVLSQFQKLLERIKYNDTALALEDTIQAFTKQKQSFDDIAEQLNSTEIAPPCGKAWTAQTVEKVINRIGQLQNILLMNNLLIELQPLFESHHIDDLTENLLIDELKNKGVKLPKEMTVRELREDNS